MSKAKLDEQYLWGGNWYGPGEVDIPDDLAVAIGVISELPKGESVSKEAEQKTTASKSKPKPETSSQ